MSEDNYSISQAKATQMKNQIHELIEGTDKVIYNPKDFKRFTESLFMLKIHVDKIDNFPPNSQPSDITTFPPKDK